MEESLKEQIKLLEEIIELQKQLLAAKGMSYPVYVPYVPYSPPRDPWYPWRGPIWTGDDVCIPSVWTGTSTATETTFTTTQGSSQ